MKLFKTKKGENIPILVASDPEPDPDPVPNVWIRIQPKKVRYRPDPDSQHWDRWVLGLNLQKSVLAYLQRLIVSRFSLLYF
jgi:hypothetical protein